MKERQYLSREGESWKGVMDRVALIAKIHAVRVAERTT